MKASFCRREGGRTSSMDALTPALAADRNPLSASRSRRKPTEFVEEFRVSRLELTDFVVASDSPLVLDFSVVQPRMFVGCAS